MNHRSRLGIKARGERQRANRNIKHVKEKMTEHNRRSRSIAAESWRIVHDKARRRRARARP